MLYLIHAIDKEGCEGLRKSLLGEQIEYVNSAINIKIILAGPLLIENENDSSGSLLIVDAENRNEVNIFISETPFFINGLWETLMINKFITISK
ncbi:YciI family protein [Obesumbacterium proteus]|uniref:YciI family protein n=1 Tax=Obesumbacterium proteus TaxID=82983 RepID=UPI0024306744|nr:YciI family protein [Obesumbacterium proteus]